MPRLRAEELTEMEVLPIISEERFENCARLCSVPMRRNSVLEGFRHSLLRFIQERMPLNEDDRVLIESESELGVKDIYSWVSSAYI